ncbi:hypothetical protein [Ligilactobacillus aviarius]|uniref:hypothetical protein n=1 Tax=Ligilactobacillus aviarius TaxID=1606 RepID=UPI0024BBA806|nr:hypothetical protein [Ligilactobacillus aviarius]
MLQLRNEGKIEIESLDDDYRITLKDSSIINGKFSKNEDIYSLLFYVIGDGQQFTLNQLKDAVMEVPKRFQKPLITGSTNTLKPLNGGTRSP